MGSSYTASGAEHAFLYSDGSMNDLNNLISNDSGWVLIQADAINDSGQIVGDGTIDGNHHAFLLTPVPEPSTCILLCSALLGLGWVRFVRRYMAKI